jgi:hypothetical protein
MTFARTIGLLTVATIRPFNGKPSATTTCRAVTTQVGRKNENEVPTNLPRSPKKTADIAPASVLKLRLKSRGNSLAFATKAEMSIQGLYLRNSKVIKTCDELSSEILSPYVGVVAERYLAATR